MQEQEKIAFIGTGLMGLPMAQRVMQAGYPLIVYNRTAAKAAPLLAAGATQAATAGEAVSAAGCVILMLSDAPAIEQVLFSNPPEVLREKSIVQMGTIAPEESREFNRRVTAAGGQYIEAPVLGSIPQARSGELLVLAGGSRAQFDRWQPLLETMGTAVYYVGEVGQAAALKLALNQLIITLTAGFSLSLGLVEKYGVDVEQFMTVLRNSALYAPTFDKKLPRMMARDFEKVNFPIKHMLKDVRLILSAAARQHLGSGFLKELEKELAGAAGKGLAEADYSAIFEMIVPPEKA